MKYVRVLDGEAVEIIPEYDPAFPGIPMDKRYSRDFIAPLIPVEDDVPVEQHWTYDPETGAFAEPVPEPEPTETVEEGSVVEENE